MATNITAVQHKVSRSKRGEMLGSKFHGCTVWFTGLSGAGKTTVSFAVEEFLSKRGVPCYGLDGDNCRTGLCKDLTFSPSDRAENIRRVGETAKLFADGGIVSLCSFISPYKADRDSIRKIHDEAGLPFFECHVATPVATCESRDPKGLYKMARSGAIKSFTGISAPYEAPDAAEMTVGAGGEPIEECVAAVVAFLEEAGVIEAEQKAAAGPSLAGRVFVVTGASRGFGRSAAVALSKEYTEAESKFVLVARSQEGLDGTAALMQTPANVSTVVADLGHVPTLEASLDAILAAAKAAGAEGLVLVNNAGTVGDLSKTVAESGSVEAIRSYFDLNVVSCAALTAKCVAQFAASARTIVNVSSLLAVKPFPGWGLYAAGKAARDMLHAVVPTEDESIRTLSYAPGPLDTDMQREVRETLYKEADRKIYADMHADGKLVCPDASAEKMVALLKADRFKSGSHVDYFD